MKKEDFETLKQTVVAAAKSGDMSVFSQTAVARQIAALVSAHDAQQRAEDFWSDRAPAMNEELLALRPLEFFATLVANGGKVSPAQQAEVRKLLAGLAEVRAKHEKERGAAA